MLTIGKLGAGQERYYVEKVADGAEDYYSGEGEAPGRWTGDGAAELGLDGDVGADELRAMLAGKHPSTGEPLIQSLGVNRSQGPVPGFDLTFSAPKSVSLLWALGDDETRATVRGAHERSVDAALGYMQREACWARRGKGGTEFVRGGGYIASAFRHRSSRAVRLLAPLIEDLAEWRMARGCPPDPARVFPDAHGQAWTANAFEKWRQRRFAKLVAAVGIERARPYDLRHSFASLLLHEGRDVIYVARQLGHGAELTMRTYGHVIEELEDRPQLPAEDAIREAREALRMGESSAGLSPETTRAAPTSTI